jgi:hypothetical protein
MEGKIERAVQTPEQSAKLILDILKDHELRAGNIMMLDQLRFWFLARGEDQGAFQAGLQAAIDLGLIILEPNEMIFLTRKGYEDIKAD